MSGTGEAGTPSSKAPHPGDRSLGLHNLTHHLPALSPHLRSQGGLGTRDHKVGVPRRPQTAPTKYISLVGHLKSATQTPVGISGGGLKRGGGSLGVRQSWGGCEMGRGGAALESLPRSCTPTPGVTQGKSLLSFCPGVSSSSKWDFAERWYGLKGKPCCPLPSLPPAEPLTLLTL